MTNWKKKCDKLWSDIIRQNGKCEITGIEGTPRSDGLRIAGLQAHHLIPKNTPKWCDKFRHNLSNGICLTRSVHSRFQTELGPHGNAVAQVAFWEWLKKNRKGQWEWFQENKDNKRMADKPDYELVHNELMEIYEKGIAK